MTPLIAAIDHENVKIAEILLEHGANPNQTSSNGTYPLLLLLAFPATCFREVFERSSAFLSLFPFLVY